MHLDEDSNSLWCPPSRWCLCWGPVQRCMTRELQSPQCPARSCGFLFRGHRGDLPVGLQGHHGGWRRNGARGKACMCPAWPRVASAVGLGISGVHRTFGGSGWGTCPRPIPREGNHGATPMHHARALQPPPTPAPPLLSLWLQHATALTLMSFLCPQEGACT